MPSPRKRTSLATVHSTDRACFSAVASLVGVKLARTVYRASRLAQDRGYRFEHALEYPVIVEVGSTRGTAERHGARFDNPGLPAHFRSIREVRPNVRAPPLAGRLLVSRAARLQSTRSACARSTQCSCSQTPASCQSRKRHWPITPEPQPSSRGNHTQGMLIENTKLMPLGSFRSGVRSRPPERPGFRCCSSGSTKLHDSSGTSPCHVSV